MSVVFEMTLCSLESDCVTPEDSSRVWETENTPNSCSGLRRNARVYECSQVTTIQEPVLLQL